MAIGKKGSFATTQAPVVDFGSIIRNAQDWQTEFNKRRNKVVDKFNKEKKALASSVTLPEFGTSTTKSNIAVKTELASKARDAIYNLAKQAEQAKFGGDVSLSDLRLKTQELEGQMQLYKETADFISNPESEFVQASNNGDLSEFVSEGTYNVIGGIANLDLEGVDIDENNKVILKTRNEEGETVEYSLEDYNKLIRNFPKNPKTDSIVKSFKDEFIAKIRQDPRGYLDVKTTQMSQQQADEITSKAYEIANNPMYFNQVVGEVTGVYDVFKVDQLKDIKKPKTGEPYTLSEIKDLYAGKIISEVQNRMKNEVLTEKDRAAISRDTKAAREAAEEETMKGDVLPASVSQYEGAIMNINEERGEGIEQAVTTAQFANATEIPITSNNPKFESLELNVNGSLKRFGNVTIEGVAKLPNGMYAVRGAQIETEGTTMTQPGTTVSKNVVDEIGEDNLKKIQEATERELPQLLSEISRNTRVTERELRQSIKLPSESKSFSGLLTEGDVQRVLRASNISEQDFEKIQSNDNIIFN